MIQIRHIGLAIALTVLFASMFTGIARKDDSRGLKHSFYFYKR